jgi:hypothetical protein
MGRIRGCNMAVVYAKIETISGVLREWWIGWTRRQCPHLAPRLAIPREVVRFVSQWGRLDEIDDQTTVCPKV